MSKPKLLVLALVWVLTIIALLPVFFHWQPPAPKKGHGAHLQIDLAYAAAAALCYWMYRVETKRLSRSQSFCLVYLVFLLTSITNDVHRFYVDRGSLFPPRSNLAWQTDLQDRVMNLDPGVLPHSYRFLPNSIVRWMQLSGMSFETARDIYRLIAGLLLFYALYRYGRLFTSNLGAIIAMLLVAAIYPVSFEYSAGQLTDPLSHLSFVLAFIFLETSEFGFLLTAVLVGSLVKETVLAMAGYYVLFSRSDKQYVFKAAALCAASVAAFSGVRLYVLQGLSHHSYRAVSNVTPAHFWENWNGGRWPAIVLLTAGALIPFLMIAWKETPASLKRQVLYLLPVLFLSSTLFSWLFEGRNFMPVVFVLAVVTGNYLSRRLVATQAL